MQGFFSRTRYMYFSSYFHPRLGQDHDSLTLMTGPPEYSTWDLAVVRVSAVLHVSAVVLVHVPLPVLVIGGHRQNYTFHL